MKRRTIKKLLSQTSYALIIGGILTLFFATVLITVDSKLATEIIQSGLGFTVLGGISSVLNNII